MKIFYWRPQNIIYFFKRETNINAPKTTKMMYRIYRTAYVHGHILRQFLKHTPSTVPGRVLGPHSFCIVKVSIITRSWSHYPELKDDASQRQFLLKTEKLKDSEKNMTSRSWRFKLLHARYRQLFNGFVIVRHLLTHHEPNAFFFTSEYSSEKLWFKFAFVFVQWVNQFLELCYVYWKQITYLHGERAQLVPQARNARNALILVAPW